MATTTTTTTTTTTGTMQRQRFEPQPCDGSNSSTNLAPGWTPLVCSPADFPPEIFPRALLQLIEHPEYNSTLILRSEISEDTEDPDRISVLQQQQAEEGAEAVVPLAEIDGRKVVRCIRRKLLPRRPTRDAEIEQYCTFYAPTTDDVPDTVVLTPIVSGKTPSLPYYHPAVHHLAFHYYFHHPKPEPESNPQSELKGNHASTTPTPNPYIRIEVIPLPDTPTSLDSRLYRTSLALLETVHRYGWGALTDYQKRVKHDCLIEREVYQDLYLVMRERHKHLIHAWQESTDPLKHVFEDIGIATFLMLLWRFTFQSDSTPNEVNRTDDTQDEEPWRTWPRPPGGFLDLGCGNGLLTHILVSEGYTGFGVDLRARTSWDHYPELSRDHLKVHTFHPEQHIRLGADPDSDKGDPSPSQETPTCTSTTSTAPDDANSPLSSKEEISTYFPPGVFIIGNHADELSPWLPLLATLHDASGYISIPCCPWAFDTKFQRGMLKGDVYPIPIPRNAAVADGGNVDFVESLNLGGGPGNTTSGYSMYRIWLAALSLHCGWEIESETLRIPSTRNWALVGRKRIQEHKAQALENVKEIFDIVEQRGLYKARKPEGKAGNGH